MIKHNKYFEEKIYELIRQDDEDNTFAAKIVDWILMTIVLMSVIVAFLNTFEVTPQLSASLSALETIFVVLFSIEYVIRLWTAEYMYPDLPPLQARLRYARSPMAIVDLLSIIPFYLPFFGFSANFLQIFKVVRLLRIFKINRYTNSLSLIATVLKKRATQLISSVIVIMVLIFIAAMLMYEIEHQAQPEVFKNALSAMWWAMATITTVGYGDIYPITTLGRVISAFITFLGIGLTAIPTGIISAGFIEESQKFKKKKINIAEHTYCPTCGHLVDKQKHIPNH